MQLTISGLCRAAGTIALGTAVLAVNYGALGAAIVRDSVPTDDWNATRTAAADPTASLDGYSSILNFSAGVMFAITGVTSMVTTFICCKACRHTPAPPPIQVVVQMPAPVQTESLDEAMLY